MKPELLSPAGTLKNMRYAFAYGADAVYSGQPRYSLRVRNNEFNLEKVYYSTSSIFLSLAILALLRLKTLSGVDSLPSGELGKTIGLDRIPEVKTLRTRIARFCQKTDIDNWRMNLSKDWMEENPELSAVLYIDGHIKLYYGQEASPPKRFVSRMRLCLSGTTDYWVNDVLGQPFFVVNRPSAMV